MSMFTWSAPLFGFFGDRWSDETIAEIVVRIRECCGTSGSLLDVGGGTGALAARLADATDATVTVLDATPEMLRYVPDHERIMSVVGSADKIPFADDTFDACICSDAFHHFPHPDLAAGEMARVVRPGGGVLILDFDPSRLLMKPLVFAERVMREPATFHTPHELTKLMMRHGINGAAEHTGPVSYRFEGIVATAEEGEAEQEEKTAQG
jgi:ubiquinone/menaquinone biosynthesis C-methylase UbiE